MLQRTPLAPSPDGPSSRDASSPEPAPRRDLYLLAVGVIGIVAVWLRPLGSSLWLDETGTFWVIRGSLGDVVHRALDFQGQFPAYHVLLWGWSKVAGTSEIALRIPSVLAALLAAWLCLRLAVRLFHDVGVARAAACVFVLLPPVAFAAGDARPYALALASLLGATLALVRWLQEERTRDGILYVVLVALTLSLHYLFALALVAHVVLAYRPVREKGRRGAAAAAAAAAGLGVLLFPTIPHFLEVFGRRSAMSLFTFGSVPALLAWVGPPAIVVSFLAGALVNLPDDPRAARTAGIRRDLVVFLALWLVLPPLTLYLAGRVSGIGLYAERHFLSSIPALALAAAGALAILSSRRQRIALVVLAMLFVLSTSSPFHVRSDWQGAAEAVDALSDGPDTPVLVYTGFSESREMEWVLDEERSQLFLAPLIAYSVDERMFPLPFELTEDAATYVDRILASVVPGADRIILVSSEATATYDVWVAERTSGLGFSGREVGDFGEVRVLVFERQDAAD